MTKDTLVFLVFLFFVFAEIGSRYSIKIVVE